MKPGHQKYRHVQPRELYIHQLRPPATKRTQGGHQNRTHAPPSLNRTQGSTTVVGVKPRGTPHPSHGPCRPSGQPSRQRSPQYQELCTRDDTTWRGQQEEGGGVCKRRSDLPDAVGGYSLPYCERNAQFLIIMMYKRARITGDKIEGFDRAIRRWMR